ncbi:MAG: hypothetical protein QXD89_00555 [Candidatus Aenigmatarchaeota archaeon]
MKIKYTLVFLSIILFLLIIVFFYKFKQVEKEKFNEDFCKKIETPIFKKICEIQFTRDPTLCSNLENFKNLCYDFVFPISIKNYTFCSKLEKYDRSVCFFYLAKEKNNIEYCEERYARGLESICYWYFAIKLKNSSLCEKVISDEKYYCLAEVLRKPELCERIPENERLEILTCKAIVTNNIEFCRVEGKLDDYCIKDLAIRINNIDLCKFIENEEIKSKCLTELTKDYSHCYQIKERIWKDYCLLGFIKNLNKK